MPQCLCVCVCAGACEFSSNQELFKGKVKAVPVLTCWSTTPWRHVGDQCCSSNILNLCTECKRMVGFTSRSLYTQGKSLSYALDKRLRGPRSRSGCCGEGNNLLPYILTWRWKKFLWKHAKPCHLGLVVCNASYSMREQISSKKNFSTENKWKGKKPTALRHNFVASRRKLPR
jgi:hypothetical protein